MKILKRLALASLVVTTSIVGVACGNKELPAETAPATPPAQTSNNDTVELETPSNTVSVPEELTPEEGAKLLFWIDNENYGNAIVEGFNKIYPDVEIEVVEVSDVDNVVKMELDGPAGYGADVFILAHDNFARALDSGILFPLYDEVAQNLEDVISQNALDTVTVGNEMYGVPVIVEAVSMFYNKNIVGENPATTFEEIFEFAETFNDPVTNQYAFATNISNAYYAYAFLTPYGFEIFGPDGTDADNPGFDSDAFERGLEVIQSFNTILPVKSLDLQEEFITEQFKADKIAYIVDGPWRIEGYMEAGTNFGIMKIPTIEGNTPTPFAGIKNAHVSMYTDYPDAAMLFAEYLGSIEGANILYNTVYKIPAIADASLVDGLADDEHLSKFLEQFQDAFPMPSINRMSYFWTVAEKAIGIVFDGQVTPAEARTSAVTEWNSLVASE